MHRLICVLLVIIMAQLTLSCYLTNCPIGGKRSLRYGLRLHVHQCPRCGGDGQCFGPTICCTSTNCRMGHALDIQQCSAEDHKLEPCSINAIHCSGVPNGHCAANGICCNSEACRTDENCLLTFDQDADSSHEEVLTRPKVSRF